MARWAPEKKDQLESLATEILHNYGKGRALVAVDGRHGAGQKTFADGLAGALEAAGADAFRASMEDFFRPRFDRERATEGRDWYRDAYDYSLLRRVLIDPYRTAGSTGFVLTGFDAVRDQPVFQPKWQSAGPDAVLVVDGVFLNRSEISGVWNYSIWLSTPALESEDPDAARNAAADEAYLKDANPSEKATAIIDNQDPEHPRRVFADSC